MNRIFFFFLSLLFLQGCFLFDENVPNQTLEPMWSHDYGLRTIGIEPVVTDKLVLFSAAQLRTNDGSSNSELIALDKNSGELIWKWADHFESTYQAFSYGSLKPVYDNSVAITIGGRNFCIDLETGETRWKNRNKSSTSRSDLTNLGDVLFRTDIEVTDSEHIERIAQGNFNTGEWRNIYTVTGGDSIRQGLAIPSFYFEPDGDTVMVFTNTQANFNQNVIVPRLISYNKTKKELYYDILLDEPAIGRAVDWFPIIEDDRVYISVDFKMVCHNVITSERIWERRLNANILGSNFLLVDGRIYSQTEGGDPTLWCLDAETGNVIWKISSFGFSSPLNYFNEQIVYVGGGFLRYIDAFTGEVLAEIVSPTSFKNDNDFFSSACTVDPETGNTYVVSFTKAFCYPPLER